MAHKNTKIIFGLFVYVLVTINQRDNPFPYVAGCYASSEGTSAVYKGGYALKWNNRYNVTDN